MLAELDEALDFREKTHRVRGRVWEQGSVLASIGFQIEQALRELRRQITDIFVALASDGIAHVLRRDELGKRGPVSLVRGSRERGNDLATTLERFRRLDPGELQKCRCDIDIARQHRGALARKP